MLHIYPFDGQSKFQSNLLARGICSEAQVQKVIQDECLPLVGKQQGEFEHALEIMDVRGFNQIFEIL